MTEKLPPKISNVDETFKDLIDKARYYINAHGNDATASQSPLKSGKTDGDEVQDVSQNDENAAQENNESSSSNTSEAASQNQNSERVMEVIEQFDPGVYVTVLQQLDGTKLFKRVRFRYF